MSIQVSGINNLIKKLNNISNIDTQTIVEEVADDMIVAIRNKANTFAPQSSQYVGRCDIRKYKLGCYIDVGLQSSIYPFELWKNLLYHQWGYFDKGLNFGPNSTLYISMHQLWFTEAKMEAEKDIKKKLKARLQQEIQKEWKG